MSQHTLQSVQSNLTLLLFVVLLVGAGLMAVKLTPEYVEFYQIKHIFKSVVEDLKLDRNAYGIKSSIQKRLQTNAISGFDLEHEFEVELTVTSIQSLLKELDYQPTSLEIFRQALTHKSYGSNHNERLEFIGDALLDLVISDLLYKRFETLREGKLSQFRASLVKGGALAEMAKSLNLSAYIRVGEGERKSQVKIKVLS